MTRRTITVDGHRVDCVRVHGRGREGGKIRGWDVRLVGGGGNSVSRVEHVYGVVRVLLTHGDHDYRATARKARLPRKLAEVAP